MAEARNFSHNHYVPEWYQRRFMHRGQGKYWYLDRAPEKLVNNGHRYIRRDLLHWGPVSCFAMNDLYTVKWGERKNFDIEKFFFGRVDANGKSAVEFFSNYRFDRAGQRDALHNLINYMSVQKLRTPKGLAWLSAVPGGTDHNLRLIIMQEIQNQFGAIWTESVWQIADATQSPTKFIISDHPVTAYNRACFPGSKFCIGPNDPDVRMVGTHTVFPLSIDKILILTNLAWVRNPYQDERKLRPNPDFFRHAMFNFMDIQTHRSLSEQEVMEINYITKQRAFRYVAAAERDWLYPEEKLPSTHWKKFGRGLLLMPEPREIYMGGEIIVGYEGGGAESWDEYGRRPWDADYNDKRRYELESAALDRFKLEWAVMQGPVYRGTSNHFHRNPQGPYVTPPESHQRALERAHQMPRRR